jgi:hypothetical protein
MVKEKGISSLWKEIKEEGFVDYIIEGNLMKTKIHSIGKLVETSKHTLFVTFLS